MNKKLVLGFLLVSLLAIGGTVFLIGKTSGSASGTVASSGETQGPADAKAVTPETSFDWGTIGINAGKAEKIFEIKNEGSDTLELSNVKTSCACTSAQLSLGDTKSGIFSMHTKSNYIFKVPAGQTASLKVIFDPLFHGPGGVGAISRTITATTNDPNRAELSFFLTANVIK